MDSRNQTLRVRDTIAQVTQVGLFQAQAAAGSRLKNLQGYSKFQAKLKIAFFKN